MKKRDREFQPRYIESMNEYLKLGDELKNTTRIKLAEKFDIDPYALSGIARLDMQDIELIMALLADRQEILIKRKKLRQYLHP